MASCELTFMQTNETEDKVNKSRFIIILGDKKKWVERFRSVQKAYYLKQNKIGNK